MSRRLVEAFGRARGPVLSAEQLRAAGVSARAIRAAVRAGELREGVTGYWLPAPPDPGAIAVMRRALGETEVES